MKKRIVSLVVMLVIMGTIANAGIFGFGKKKSQKTKDGKVVVNMWRHNGTPQEDAYYNEMIEKFNSTSKTVNVEVTKFPDNVYHDQIRAAALTGDMPHILDFDAVEGPNFVNAGAMQMLDEYITPEMKKDILKSVFYKESGETYAIGQFDSGLSFWVNKDYLNKAGVRIPTFGNAWTKTEFEDALAKLKALPEIEYPLDAKVNYGAGWWIYGYQPFVKSFGGEWWDANKKRATGTLNGPGTVKAFEYMQWLVENEYVNPNQTTDGNFYLDKNAAIALVGHWMYPPHKENLGDAAALAPITDFGNGSWAGSGSFAWGMTARAKEDGVDEAAWEVIKFFMGANAIKELVAANGAVPASKTVLSELPEYKSGAVLELYKQQLEGGNYTVRPVTPAFSSFQNEVGEAMSNILAGGDVKRELDRAAKNIDEVIVDNQYHK